ncbi:MAG: UDP-N-acetylglucosamine--N-acetylmuramyl-(pentapeptide) pyrophosphoryl-undecaprenol [Actinomycetota bacterium]|nr:UDP-N-acetylglucosamine--N-acetylmuramyl-(pentapeptide) pyrophosphoryl-undecaprenol [Actinomycetota bacterium]
MHVAIAGGGTAGHIEPALALADALRRRDPSIGITALGTARGLETRLVPARGYELALIPPVPIPRRPNLDLLRTPVRLRAAIDAAAAVLRRENIDVLVGFGGYVAGPAYLAARRLAVPIVVHEANPRPGWANRLGARFTRFVAVSFPGTGLRNGQYVGLPIRRAIATLDRAASRTEGRSHFGLATEAPTLLVTGGSQGARRLNEAVAGAAPALAEAGIQVLHAAGPANVVTVDRPPGSPAYVVVPYLDRMDLAYAAADLALCRAGANTVVEMAAVGLPAAFVPLPIGNGEQELNARPVVDAGGGLLVEDAACTPEWVAATLTPLLHDPARLATMSAAAAALGRRDADERLADMVLAAAASKGAARP